MISASLEILLLIEVMKISMIQGFSCRKLNSFRSSAFVKHWLVINLILRLASDRFERVLKILLAKIRFMVSDNIIQSEQSKLC